jgi:predicted nucleotidyltransferase
MAVINDIIQRKALAAVEFIGQAEPVQAAYLFGSQIDGPADEFRDIDIAVFIRDAENWDFRKQVTPAVRTRTEVGDDIERHFFAAYMLDNPPQAGFAEYEIENGIRIWGEE